MIQDRIMAGHTHAAIASELQQLNPGAPGLSARSVRRYCSVNNVHFSSRLTSEQLEGLVERAVFQV